jgi:hypothetical protein
MEANSHRIAVEPMKKQLFRAMSEPIQISAKNLGALTLLSFCARCFWLRMKCHNRLPYQVFPGIFSSIDGYSKKITNHHFDRHGRVPTWFDGFGELGSPIKVPGWSRFQFVDVETNIRLTGVPDEILRHPKKGLSILDYKTARFTDTQDALAPMYDTQLNAYAVIAKSIGLGTTSCLGLLYYEPVTELIGAGSDSLIKDDRFLMEFSPKLKAVKLEPDTIPPLLRRVREICDLPECPAGHPDCHDCSLLENLVRGGGKIFSPPVSGLELPA